MHKNARSDAMKLDSVKTRQQENPHLKAAEVEVNQNGKKWASATAIMTNQIFSVLPIIDDYLKIEHVVFLYFDQ